MLVRHQKPTPPNRFGSVLNYFAEGYRYVFPATKADQRRMAHSLLESISHDSRYNKPDIVNVGQAINLALTSSWFYSGTKIIADRIAATDARPRAKKRTGSELRDQPNHAFDQLLNRPNALMTWELIARYTVWWLKLIGNAYLFVGTPKIGDGLPEEIWPLPANAVTPLPETIRISRTTGKPVIDYGYTLNGKTWVLPGENVVHMREANPTDYWVGLSPLVALLDPIKLDKYQSKYLQSFFGRDNAIPTAIISVPQGTSEFDFEAIKEQIREQFGRGGRSSLVTRAGEISVETISQTLQDMEVVTSRKFNREEVYYVLGIPDGLIAGGESGDSRLATEITFARNTTQPLLDMIASALDSVIAPYYGPNIVIAAPSIIPQDRALAITEYTAYSPDRTINENRRVQGIAPLDLPAIMDEINAIRESDGLDPITTPLDDAMLDLMLRIPVRLISVLSSNTSTYAGKTGLRVGQKDASGEVIEDPYDVYMQRMQEASGGDESGGNGGNPDGSSEPAESGAGNMEKQKDQADQPTQITGAHFVESNAGRSYLVHAARIGQQQELRRWRTVAMDEIKRGRDASQRPFQTEALPAHIVQAVGSQLAGADIHKAAVIFDTWNTAITVMH